MQSHQYCKRSFRSKCISMSVKPLFRDAGPTTPKPEYEDSSWWDQTAIKLFRSGLIKSVGHDVSETGFAGIMELARELNRKFKPKQTQLEVQGILRGFFPRFILVLFPLMFSGPFPAFSAKLNTLITRWTCMWLMGPMVSEDLATEELLPGWGDGKGQAFTIERCRFLEESGCASVCINTCKVPTQAFFAQDLGVPLSMEPDYDTFRCRFKFGKAPPAQEQDPVFTTPCFAQCPSRGGLRAAHAATAATSIANAAAAATTTTTAAAAAASSTGESLCSTVRPAGGGDVSGVPPREVFVRNFREWLLGFGR